MQVYIAFCSIKGRYKCIMNRAAVAHPCAKVRHAAKQFLGRGVPAAVCHMHDRYNYLPVQWCGVYFSYKASINRKAQYSGKPSIAIAMDISTISFISAVLLVIGNKEGLCHRCIHDRIAVSCSITFFLYNNE